MKCFRKKVKNRKQTMINGTVELFLEWKSFSFLKYTPVKAHFQWYLPVKMGIFQPAMLVFVDKNLQS